MKNIKIKIDVGTYNPEETGCDGMVHISLIGEWDDGVSFFARSEGIGDDGIYDLILNLTDIAKNYVRDEMKKENLKK